VIKNVKSSKTKEVVTDKGKPIRLGDFQQKLQARREWHDIFKVPNEKNLQPRYSIQQGYHSE